MPDELEFDAVVIGSGKGGTLLALEFAKYGFNTALIEKDALHNIERCSICPPKPVRIAQ